MIYPKGIDISLDRYSYIQNKLHLDVVCFLIYLADLRKMIFLMVFLNTYLTFYGQTSLPRKTTSRQTKRNTPYCKRWFWEDALKKSLWEYL